MSSKVNLEAPFLLDFNLDRTFFGFRPQDRPYLHENIFNMLWHGEGRWTWDEIYEMPVFLRTFYSKQINKLLQIKLNAAEQRANQTKSTNNKIPRKPGR
jgi:hypothetical protein